MSRRVRIKRVMLTHIFSYEYFFERITRYVIGLTFIILIIYLANWIRAAYVYTSYPIALSYPRLGLSLIITILALMSLGISMIIVRVRELARRREVRRSTALGREITINVVLITLLTVTLTTIVFIAYLTRVFVLSP